MKIKMKLKYDYIIQELLGEYVAVPIGVVDDGPSKLVRLNATAKVVFEGVMANHTVNQISETLAELCEKQPNEVVADVESFIETLAQKDLLVME